MYSPPEVDILWGICRSYCNISVNSIFYLLQGNDSFLGFGLEFGAKGPVLRRFLAVELDIKHVDQNRLHR